MYANAKTISFANCIAINGPYNKGFVQAIKENIIATHRMYDEKLSMWIVWKPYVNDARMIISNYYSMSNTAISDVYVKYPLGAKFDYESDQIDYVSWDAAYTMYANHDRKKKQRFESESQKEKRQREEYRSYEDAFRSYSRRTSAGFGADPRFTHIGTPVRTIERTPRQILFVTEDAPIEVVMAAYKALAKKCHPDTGNGNHEEMLRINEAYKKITGT